MDKEPKISYYNYQFGDIQFAIDHAKYVESLKVALAAAEKRAEEAEESVARRAKQYTELAERNDTTESPLAAAQEALRELPRLQEIEHRTWHLLDDSEQRTDEIILSRGEDYDVLCELLPEEHPRVALSASATKGGGE